MPRAFRLIATALLLAACATTPPKPEESTTTEPPPKSPETPASTVSTAANSPAAEAEAQVMTEAQSSAIKALQPVTVYFGFDSALLQPAGREALAAMARQYLQRAGPLMLEGHADERGTEEYNLVLGQSRADAVKKYLVRLGAKEKSLATRSFGETRPADAGHDESAWGRNRRVELKPQAN